MAGSLRAVAATLFMFSLIGPINADTLDQIRQRGAIRWGGDQEGGGPYIYPHPDDPRRVTGFEVDLMDLLAARFGVRSDFQQRQWSNLPDCLRIDDIDVIVNGYELTQDHLASKIATIPYYLYELQLIARRDEPTIASWDDLKSSGKSGKKKVGLLLGSAAEKFVRDRLGQDVQIVPYEGTTDALLDVKNKKLDATVQDLPAAIFYQKRYPELHFVGSPVGQGQYVMYLRPGDDRLRTELNQGILALLKDGQLRELYKRYGIWNPTQEELLVLAEKEIQADAGPAQESKQQRGWEVVQRNLPILLEAAAMTVVLTLLAMPLAILIGLAVALGRLYGPWPLRWVLAWYVEVLRGTPVMLQLYTIFFVLPGFGIRIPALAAAVLGLAINYSAYEAEIYRAGLLAIPAGQMEAALSLGMSRFAALRRVIVPQAVRMVIPPVTNDFVALFKDTSICSVITVVELTKRYNILANSTGAYLEMAAITALLYLLMSYPLSLLARRLEHQRSPHVAM